MTPPSYLHLLFASLHLLLGHFGSALLYRWRYGRDPLVLHRAEDSPHRRWSRRVGLFSAIWAITLLLSTFSEEFRASFLGRPLWEIPRWLSGGIATGGLFWMLIAQVSMGKAFRVGQDVREAPDALCEAGLHRHSRNPIYLGSWSCLLGMTLWWPGTLFLISCFAVGWGIHQLVLAEEVFLRGQFGAAYEAYFRRVPRYLGIRR